MNDPIARLPDPRDLSTAPAHPLHALTERLLTEREPGRLLTAETALDDAIATMLAREEDGGVDAAIATAPSSAMRWLLFDRLRAVVERPLPSARHHAVPFLIPVVMVAGVRGQQVMPGHVQDPDALLAVLRQHGLVDAAAEIRLLPELVDRAQLLAIRPGQLAQWRDTVALAADGLPHVLAPSPVEVNGDGVFLRYLVGVAIQRESAPPAVQLGAPSGAWALALGKLLQTELGDPSVTLFMLPRPPQAWLPGLDDGRVAQQQIRFEVFASTILRKLRTMGETPVAILSTHEDGELRVTIGAERNREEWAGYVWKLAPLDRVDAVAHQLCEVLHECRQDDIRVMGEVLPSIKDNLPYFPQPGDLPTPRATH
jgi:hypothetical protein